MFKFSADNLKSLQKNVKNYPAGKQQSAVMFALTVAQTQNGGWLSSEAIEYVATLLQVPVIKVFEIASFYSMYNFDKVGKYHVKICTNIVCMLRGSDELFAIAKNLCNDDENFTVVEEECLGACVNAPVAQINGLYYENLSPKKITKILQDELPTD